MAGQLVLMGAVFLSPLLGRAWHGSAATASVAAGGAILALGVLLLGWGGLRLGRGLTPFPAPGHDRELQTGGPYGVVRHPMYGGGILVALGWALVFAAPVGLAFTGVLAVFLDLKARREESWLRELVPGYGAYCERVPRRLLPYLY